ncbi:MAG: ABC transporter ATP-binding protein [Firmicutes bacterium]|jgi:oligopeptide/dipeptide ABC transporter ATP-binding protein|nr:ABC transporter ATP-binding protein [Bacillota bacterium]
MEEKLLKVEDLKVYFKTHEGLVKAVDGVDFSISKGRVLGIAGESGSGKSMTSLAIMNLIPQPNGYIESGNISFRGKSLLNLNDDEIRKIRGNSIAMIFQEPMTSLNPVFTVGEQIGEALEIHQGLKGRKKRDKTIELLNLVKIPRAEKVVDEYPHQLSGGMRQRVMIAIALSCNPELLIADEPTTALDVTIQAQILYLMKDITKKLGSSIMFITHDLGVIAEMADDVAIMYFGKIVEEGSVVDILNNPMHPYTKGLIKARPDNFTSEDGFSYIEGKVASFRNSPKGCAFYDRCLEKSSLCKDKMPELSIINENRKVRCWKYTNYYDDGKGEK